MMDDLFDIDIQDQMKRRKTHQGKQAPIFLSIVNNLHGCFVWNINFSFPLIYYLLGRFDFLSVIYRTCLFSLSMQPLLYELTGK